MGICQAWYFVFKSSWTGLQHRIPMTNFSIVLRYDGWTTKYMFMHGAGYPSMDVTWTMTNEVNWKGRTLGMLVPVICSHSRRGEGCHCLPTAIIWRPPFSGHLVKNAFMPPFHSYYDSTGQIPAGCSCPGSLILQGSKLSNIVDRPYVFNRTFGTCIRTNSLFYRNENHPDMPVQDYLRTHYMTYPYANRAKRNISWDEWAFLNKERPFLNRWWWSPVIIWIRKIRPHRLELYAYYGYKQWREWHNQPQNPSRSGICSFWCIGHCKRFRHACIGE